MNCFDKPMLENLTIRPMTRSDITPLVLLETEIFPDPWPESAFVKALRDGDHSILVAESNKIIAGYAAYIIASGEARLTNIAVSPDFRGKSVAKILLSGILEIVKKADCEYIFLDVRPTNSAAICLYQKFGFYELYRRSNYYLSPVEDAVVMVKNLREDDF